MFDESFIILPLIERAARDAGLTLVSERSKATDWPARAMTSGTTAVGRRVDLEVKVIPDRNEASFRLIDHYRCQVSVLIEQRLPAGLQLIDWKSARRRNRYVWLLRKNRYVPVPPEGDPVLGLTADDESERGLFFERNRLVFSQFESQIVQRDGAAFTAWVWEMSPLPYWGPQERIDRETASYVRTWAEQIDSALADADKLRQLH